MPHLYRLNAALKAKGENSANMMPVGSSCFSSSRRKLGMVV